MRLLLRETVKEFAGERIVVHASDSALNALSMRAAANYEVKKPAKEKKPEEAKKPAEEEKKEAEKLAEDGKKEEKKSDESKAEQTAATPPPPPPPQEIVLRVFMHCEGCARKVRRCLKGFEGVEEVITDCRSSKVVVKGEKAYPLKVLERVQRVFFHVCDRFCDNIVFRSIDVIFERERRLSMKAKCPC